MNNEYRDVISFDGTPLKCLIRETGNSKWLIVTHGLGEHLGRHEHLLKLFSQSFNIAIYDLRGHGRSGGRKGWVNSFQDFSKDLDMIISYLKKEFSMTSYILLGHSMGGLIVSDYLQNMASKSFYPEKVFLSSPAVAGPGSMGTCFSNSPKFLLNSLAKLPTFSLGGMLNLRKLSHDSRVYESYIKDEFNQLKVHTRLFFELLRTARDVFSRPLRAECPLYMAIGSEDCLVNGPAAVKYFSEIEKNTQLKVFEGGYHELHNEIEKFRGPYFDFLRKSLTGLTF